MTSITGRFKTAIVGSRLKYWEEIGATKEGCLFVCEYAWKRRAYCEFISGQSPGGGVDEWIETFCNKRSIPFTAKPPVRFTTEAFHARNREIVDASNVVVAFCAGRITGGTKYTIEYAKRLNKHIVIYIYKDGEWTREEINAPSTNRP